MRAGLPVPVHAPVRQMPTVVLNARVVGSRYACDSTVMHRSATSNAGAHLGRFVGRADRAAHRSNHCADSTVAKTEGPVVGMIRLGRSDPAAADPIARRDLSTGPITGMPRDLRRAHSRQFHLSEVHRAPDERVPAHSRRTTLAFGPRTLSMRGVRPVSRETSSRSAPQTRTIGAISIEITESESTVGGGG